MDPTVLQPLLALLPAGTAGQVAAWIAAAAAAWSLAVTIAATIDKYVPQPIAGSRWVPVRQAVSWVAQNGLHAANRIPAGFDPADAARLQAQIAATAKAIETARATDGKPASGGAS